MANLKVQAVRLPQLDSVAKLEISNHYGNHALLGQFQIWPAVAVESEGAVRVYRDGEFRHIFLLVPESITHAIASICNIWECDCCGSLADFFRGALDLFVSNLDVLVKVHGTIAREDQVHIQDERNTSFVLTRKR